MAKEKAQVARPSILQSEDCITSVFLLFSESRSILVGYKNTDNTIVIKNDNTLFRYHRKNH
ncbi:MAG: hypothetical protein M8364_12815 [Methylobacter sp.]|uniref:hypothetical protein n=1 Tax=Methylobacter sp. TaxID=2051955 RepID=UPI0025863BFB|nr:hypothetical protein [Methylobacter sp.]MCL7421777.1 hypothetical protein [Methylobacter sp.]